MKIKGLFALVAIMIMTTSCGLAKFSDIARNAQFERITSIQLKGMTGIEVRAEVVNGSNSAIAMESGVVKLFDNDKAIATLTQVGSTSIEAKSSGEVRTIWRIEGIDPMALLTLAARLTRSEYEGLSIGYEAELIADKKRKKVSGKRIDVKEILATFAL